MKKLIIFFSALVFVLFLIFISFYYSIFIKENKIDKSFIVNKGDTVSSISLKLKKEKIISNDFLFKFYFNYFKKENIKAGKYVFLGSYNIPKISEVLTTKTEFLSKTKKLTIIEGWNKYDVSEYLSKNTNYKYDEIYNFIEKDFKNSVLINKYSFLDNKNIINLDGFLYPDTYEIYEDSNIETIFSKILDNFKDKVIDKYTNIKTEELYDLIKKASIIEKEAKFDQDRQIVSSVIDNRIRLKMRLEMDSTVLYFTQDRNNIARDKFIENGYNTYRNFGLPIGPIGNPSIKSIDAAINPKNTNYLYFVNKDSGEAVFAETLEEHNLNIKKYLW